MQPYEVFKERLVLYRMEPDITALERPTPDRPRPRLVKSIAKIRLVVASCAVLAMTVVFAAALATH
ncbi:MAG TPA: hypothetical protein VMW18_12085 [Candidatus Binatia bacterium]|nr:hypothetical protein [Candidatus Binatia bacterium]